MAKKVKFNYFVPRDETDGLIYSLRNIFDGIIRRYQNQGEKEVYEYNNEVAKLNYISLEPGTNDMYHLVFERLRDYGHPVKTTLHGDSENIDLNDDEFIGEEVVVLYDSTNHIVMIQNNIHSLSARAIELFFGSMIQNYHEDPDNDIQFVLSIVNDTYSHETVNFMIERTRSITFKANQNFEDNISNDLFQTIENSINETEANEYEVEIKIVAKTSARSDRPYLPDQIVNRIVNFQDDDSISKLRVKGRNPNDSLQEVNVLSQKLETYITFERVEGERRLHPSAIFAEMIGIYNLEERTRVLRCLRR